MVILIIAFYHSKLWFALVKNTDKKFVKKMLKEIIGADAGQVITFALLHLIRNSSSS